MVRPPRRSTLFPSATLFRSKRRAKPVRFRTRARRRNIAARSAPYSDRKSTRLNSSHLRISYAVFCLKKKPWSILPGPPAHLCDEPGRSLGAPAARVSLGGEMGVVARSRQEDDRLPIFRNVFFNDSGDPENHLLSPPGPSPN